MASKREREPSGAFAADPTAGPAGKSAAPAPKKPRLGEGDGESESESKRESESESDGDDSKGDSTPPQKTTNFGKSTKAKDARKRKHGPKEVAEEESEAVSVLPCASILEMEVLTFNSSIKSRQA